MKVELTTLLKFPKESSVVTTGVFFHKKGILITGHENGVVALWALSEGASFRILYDCHSRIDTISSSPKGELVVGSHQGEIVVLSPDGKSTVVESARYGVKLRIWASVWLNENSFAVGSTYGEVKLFVRKDNQWTKEKLSGHSDSVFGMGRSLNGLLTTGDYFGNILVWEPKGAGYIVQQKMKIQGTVEDISWLKDDAFAAINRTGEICVFEKSAAQEAIWQSVYEVKDATSFGNTVYIAEDGKTVFAGTTTEVIQFDTETQQVDSIDIASARRIFGSRDDIFVLSAYGLYKFTRKNIEVRPDLIKYKYFKIGLVGHTGVGKSTLCNYITTGSFADLSSTPGKKIWIWELPKDDGLDKRLILTDYGGQETALSTFLPFLLDSDIILILWQQNDITTLRKAFQILYDLKPKVADSVKIFFVQTHIDEKKIPEFDQRTIMELKEEGGIIDNFKISSKFGTGIDDLKSSVLKEISWDKARIIVQTISANAVLQTIMALQDMNIAAVTPEEFVEYYKTETNLAIGKTHLKFLLRDYSNHGIIEYNSDILDLIIFNHPEYNQLRTDVPIYVMKQDGIIRNEDLSKNFNGSRFLPVIIAMYLKYRIAIENFEQLIFPKLLSDNMRDIPEPYLSRLRLAPINTKYLPDKEIDMDVLLRALSELQLRCIRASKRSGVFSYEENATIYYKFEKGGDPFEGSHLKCNFRVGGTKRSICERLSQDFLDIVENLFGPFLKVPQNDDKKKVDADRTIIHDVAISYASEQREYAARVAGILRAKGVRVFFDPFFETKMWGKELPEYLMKVYYKESRYCMIFISKEYVSKAWPTFELKCAIARRIESMGEYILPVRFDDSEVPGLSTTITYLDANEKTPDQIADMFMEKMQE